MSEPQRLANDAKSDWELTFETIGDPHQEIAKQCRDRGWLELFINEQTSFITNTDDRLSHPKGYFQPGVLGIDSNKRILYRWRSLPTRANIGGAAEREVRGAFLALAALGAGDWDVTHAQWA